MEVSYSDIIAIISTVSLIAVLVGDRTLGWLKTRGIDLTKLEDIYELAYNTHAIVVETEKLLEAGTLEKAIEVLAKNTATQTQLLQAMINQSELQHAEHKLILDQLSALNNKS